MGHSKKTLFQMMANPSYSKDDEEFGGILED